MQNPLPSHDWHVPPQFVPKGDLTSAGQVADNPVHVSATSHPPGIAALHIVPAFPGTLEHDPRLHVSTVHGLLSLQSLFCVHPTHAPELQKLGVEHMLHANNEPPPWHPHDALVPVHDPAFAAQLYVVPPPMHCIQLPVHDPAVALQFPLPSHASQFPVHEL